MVAIRKRVARSNRIFEINVDVYILFEICKKETIVRESANIYRTRRKSRTQECTGTLYKLRTRECIPLRNRTYNKRLKRIRPRGVR